MVNLSGAAAGKSKQRSSDAVSLSTEIDHDVSATRVIMQSRSDLVGHTAYEIRGELSRRLKKSGVSASPEEIERVAMDISRVTKDISTVDEPE